MIIRTTIPFLRPAALLIMSVLATVAQVGGQPKQEKTGFYVVLADAPAAEGLPRPAPDQQIARYDQKFLREVEREPPRYLLLRTRPDVRLSLAKPPETAKGSKGFTELFIELTSEAAVDLERVSRDHLGKNVAFVIEGEVVSTHTIRSAITGGQFRLSRCTDNACEEIRARLTQRQ